MIVGALCLLVAQYIPPSSMPVVPCQPRVVELRRLTYMGDRQKMDDEMGFDLSDERLPIERILDSMASFVEADGEILTPLLVQLVPIGAAVLISKVVLFSAAPPPLFPWPVPSMPIVVLGVLALALLGTGTDDR